MVISYIRYVKVIVLKISLLVDLATPVVTGHVNRCIFILHVPEFRGASNTPCEAALSVNTTDHSTTCFK